MSKGTLMLACLAGSIVSACSRERPAQESRSGAATPEPVAAAASFAAGAANLTDACSVIPGDLAQRLVRGAGPPQRQQFPLQCRLSNDTAVLEITFDLGPDEPVNGAKFVSGLARGGYMEHLDPRSQGDTYLTVILGQAPDGMNHNMHVEVAAHDGKDHEEDAVVVARSILARLK